MEEATCVIIGRVQGVMYRDFVRRNARKRGIAGFVRNRDDGAVVVVAEGERKKVETLIALLRRGPLLSRVDDVFVAWRPGTHRFSGFDIVL